MKKILFLAVAVIALITTGCENMQPTQVSSKDLKDKVTVSGYARYSVTKLVNGKGQVQKPQLLTDQDLVLYYGMKDAEGKMAYTHYALKTNEDGYFAIDLPLQPGKVIIDEVKVVCSFSLDLATYAYNKVSKKWEMTNADFFGEVAKQNLAAGSSYYYALEVAAVAYTSSPDLEQPK